VRVVSLGVLLVAGCGDDLTTIDGRRDATAGDVGVPRDGGVPDASRDAGSPDPDGGCVGPMPPPPFMPVDTGGPAGESVDACIARVGSMTDDRLPADQGYDLTTFGGPGDEQPVSCIGAPVADGTWFYAANAQRFACGQRVRLVDAARTRCVIAEVADVGPHACVEAAGGRAIWDVSPLASEELFGVTSVGWSDHLAVFGAPVGPDNALGACDHLADPGALLAGFIGGSCDGTADCAFTGGTCLTASVGWPGGHCSSDCTSACPDRAGPYAYTACHAFEDGTTRCLARCDYTLFATGCRAGYGCVDSRNPATGALRRVCLPASC